MSRAHGAKHAPPRPPTDDDSSRLHGARYGLAGGLVGILCCVGPTVLASFGAISASVAISWGNTLYGDYAWPFRIAGLAAMGLLVWIALRRRGQCSMAGVRAARRQLVIMLGVAVITYVALYAITTLLGHAAR